MHQSLLRQVGSLSNGCKLYFNCAVDEHDSNCFPSFGKLLEYIDTIVLEIFGYARYYEFHIGYKYNCLVCRFRPQLPYQADAPEFIASILKLEKVEKCSDIKIRIFSSENFCQSHYGCSEGPLTLMKLPAQNISDWLTAGSRHNKHIQVAHLKSIPKNKRRLEINVGYTYDMIELVEHIKSVSKAYKIGKYI